jgi:hypothetical protein
VKMEKDWNLAKWNVRSLHRIEGLRNLIQE